MVYLDSNPHPYQKNCLDYIVHKTLDQSASDSLIAVRAFNYLYYLALTHIHVYMYFTVGYI